MKYSISELFEVYNNFEFESEEISFVFEMRDYLSTKIRIDFNGPVVSFSKYDSSSFTGWRNLISVENRSIELSNELSNLFNFEMKDYSLIVDGETQF